MTVFMVFEREATTDANELKLYGETVGAARGDHPMTALVYNGELDVLEGGPVENVVVRRAWV